jgi:tetratricopeptide (TPR) repeat protein
MGKIIICKTKSAYNPYTFLNTKVSVYSYEELCYYIYNNMVLIGEEEVSRKLTGWIRKEIDLPELADKLEALMEKNAFVQDIMVEILVYGNYYGNDEVRGFMSECQRIRNMKNYEVEKLRADGYMRYKHYIKAGAIYDEIIGYAEKNNVGNDFLGNVYHNKAVALAGNLQLDEAKEYFVKAYNLNNNDESLIEYFCVLAVTVDTATLQKEIKKRGLPENFLDDLMMEVGDSKEDVRELPIYNKVQKAVYNRLHGNLEDYDKRMNTILSELKDQFREQLV